MRTKEEILDNTVSRYYSAKTSIERYGKSDTFSIHMAMDEYAKQIAIAFAKFANEKTLQDLNDKDAWYFEKSYGNFQTLTDEELFNQFINQAK
jgi:hypothetical protein